MLTKLIVSTHVEWYDVLYLCAFFGLKAYTILQILARFA